MSESFDNAVPDSERRFYIPCLDGIRGVAILMVFAAHAGAGRLIPGGLGVTVFFFLSGYLITTLLRLEVQRTGAISIRQFYIRRAIRILPPMYITLAASFVLGAAGVLHFKSVPSAYLAAVTFFTDYFSMLPNVHSMQSAGMETLWSLCIEEHFYLIFPFVYCLFLRRRFSPAKQAGMLLAACVAALAWRTICVFVFHSNIGLGSKWTYTTTDCRFDSIVWGCILAVYNNAWFGDRRSHLLALHKTAFALLGCLGLAVSLLYRDPAFRETARYTLQSLSLYPLFYFCTAAQAAWPVRALAWRPLRRLGVLSYSLYLCHLYILREVQFRFHWHHLPAAAAISFALALLFAWIVRKTVERPLQRFRAAFRPMQRSLPAVIR